MPYALCFPTESFLCTDFSFWPERVLCPAPTTAACMPTPDLRPDHFSWAAPPAPFGQLATASCRAWYLHLQ